MEGSEITPLHLAALLGKPEIVQCLLESGARIDFFSEGYEVDALMLSV